MKGNYLIQTCIWTLCVLFVLLLLWFLPPLSIGGHTLRHVDLLSDVRPPTPSMAEEVDSLPPPPKPAFVDTCRTGMTCIEDYSDSTRRGMMAFYRALNTLEQQPRHVRIAVFGDSFIEADILTADLRNLLQSRYGGCGVGYVDITSTTYGYRPTVRHSFQGWQSHAITDSVYFDYSKQSISGHYFVARPGAYVELRGQRKYGTLLDSCRQATLYFHNKGEVTLSARINGREAARQTFLPTGDLQEMTLDGVIGSVRWTVEQADSTLFYGAAMDGDRGITVDNFALRGSSGLSLATIPQHTLHAFNDERPYDLVILLYGLNVATERGRIYDKYKEGMQRTLSHLKKALPDAGILIVSVGDRDYRTDEGELRTMPGIKHLVRYQQNIAADNAVAFWNLFEAMGGEGSMAKLVHAKPAKANLDYTHINFRGGKQLATLLYEAMIYGKEQYDRRQAYEENR